jgi:cell division septum initiation protein DivIVA
MDYQGKKITDLEPGSLSSDLLSSVYIPVADGGSTKRISLGQITALLNENIRQTTNGFIGQIIAGARTDIPRGYLRMDGQEYSSAQSLHPELWQALKDGRTPKTTFAKYNEIVNHVLTPEASSHNGYDSSDRKWNNCGYFAFDETNNKFRVPKLDNRVFISNGTNIGDVNPDQIVNFSGEFGIAYNQQDQQSEGVFRSVSNERLNGGSGNGWMHRNVWGFDASRVVKTGPRVQPRHQQYPYFICVSSVEAGIDPTVYAKTIELRNEIIQRAKDILNITNQLEDLKTQIQGKQQGKVFELKAQLDNWIGNPYNVMGLPIGFNFIVLEEDQPNYLWDGSSLRPIAKAELNLQDYYTKENLNNLLNNKVDNIPGMGLSSNDYADGDRAKVLVSVSQNQLNGEVQLRLTGDQETLNTAQTFAHDLNEDTRQYARELAGEAKDYADQRIADAELSKQIWLPAVQTKGDLPIVADATKNYLCRVINDPDKDNNGVYQWIANSAQWTYFSDNLDFVDEEELEETLNNKQDILVSGISVKTINNNSVLGEGNLTIDGGSSGLDTEMSNLSPTGKSKLINLVFPSPNYIDMTITGTNPNNSTYVAPEDGYFYLQKKSSGSNVGVTLYNLTAGRISAACCAAGSNFSMSSFIFARKGDSVLANNAGSGEVEYFRFIYAGTVEIEPTAAQQS